MIEEIYPHIYRVNCASLSEELHGSVIYLVTSPERNLMVDCGFCHHTAQEVVDNLLVELQVDCAKTDLFLTHSHFDHVGLADYLQHRGMTVYANQLEWPIPTPFVDYDQDHDKSEHVAHLLGIDIPAMEELLLENSQQVPAEAIAALAPKKCEFTHVESGYEFICGEYCFEVVALFGHTIAQQGLFERRHKLMFCGDHILSNVVPNLSSWRADEHLLQQYLDSLDWVRRQKVGMLLGGHGEPILDIGSCVEKIRENYSYKCRQILGWLTHQRSAVTVHELTTMVYTDGEKPLARYGLAYFSMTLGKTLACAEYLYDKGEIKRKEVDGTLYYWL